MKGSHGSLGTVNITVSGNNVTAAMSAAQGSALAKGDALELAMPDQKMRPVMM